MNGYASTPPGQEITDLIVLQAMIDQLDDYLSRDRVYRPMLVHTPQGAIRPAMSIGGILFRLRRLRALESRLSPAQRDALDRAEDELSRARRWYPEAYRDHVIRELRGLLHSWRWFLDDCCERLDECATEYPAEAHTRTTIQLLIDHLGEGEVPDEVLRQVAAQDDRLRRCFHGGEFIWPSEWEVAFPRQEYWWLYGLPGTRP
ncbi:MAG: hypothetical protein J7M34_12915 [Anaerolineae bacterium]|nr:hypothetical protein [Anaerolineae bacterium]